jgi:TRAP-type C4-dicarboxylate transport system substrate-binding protein
MWRGGFGIACGIMTTFSCASALDAAELRLLSSWDKTNPAVAVLAETWAKGVESASKGSIKVVINGPETVPPFEQLQPVSAGAFQVLFTHAVYHYGATGLGMGIDAVKGSVEDRRKSGLMEALDRHYQRFGLKLVALPISATCGYHLVLRSPVTPGGDLRGRKLRGTASYHSLFRAFGAAPVVLPGGEVYTALEKGVVDGAAWPAVGVLSMRWYEVAKYMMRPGFGLSHYMFLVNLNAWNRFTEEERRTALDEGRKVEEIWFREYDRMCEQEEAALIQRGMQITDLGAAQKPKIDAAWSEGQWELAEKKNGEEAKALHALLKRQGLTD